ncbi:MAG: RNA polymerase sigma-I factor [Bacilli bacterium]
MGRLSFRRNQTAGSDTLEALLAEAAAGDAEARERLLKSYLPFVERVASGVCGRAVARTDDEFQIALVALNEAIDAYKTDRGAFISFAETVMRRRLIDSFRVNSRVRELPFASFEEEDDEGNVQNTVEASSALEAYARDQEVSDRAEEIARYAVELGVYGLRFQDLVEISPKHVDARRNAIDAAKTVVSDPELRSLFLKSRSLPLKQLQGRVQVSRKTLERQRSYIVAVIVLLLGDYALLHSFIEGGTER